MSALVIIPIDELQLMLDRAVQTALRGAQQTEPVKEAKAEGLMTRQEAADYLRISLPTLGTWVKNGIIPGHRIAGRVYFRMEDLQASAHRIKPAE